MLCGTTWRVYQLCIFALHILTRINAISTPIMSSLLYSPSRHTLPVANYGMTLAEAGHQSMRTRGPCMDWSLTTALHVGVNSEKENGNSKTAYSVLMCDTATPTMVEADTECQPDEARLQNGYICRSSFKVLKSCKVVATAFRTFMNMFIHHCQASAPYLPTIRLRLSASQTDVAAPEFETSVSSIAEGSSTNQIT